MNELIRESVGPNGRAWSGEESATAFRNSWDELAAGMPGGKSGWCYACGAE